MKRLDRAMYAFFLLALLADVARSQVPASFGGESAGGSSLSAASHIRGQIRVGSAGEVVLLSRRLERSSPPVVKFKGSSFTLSRLARLFSAQGSQSTLMLLLAAPFGLDTGFSSSQVIGSPAFPPARCVFAHTGSPAP